MKLPNLRISMELFIAAVIGTVIALKSSWYDPDEWTISYSYSVLLAFGVALGLFARCRVWVIAATASGVVPIYMTIAYAVASIASLNYASGFALVELLLFFVMFAIVLIGGAVGRGVRRFLLRKRAGNVACKSP